MSKDNEKKNGKEGEFSPENMDSPQQQIVEGAWMSIQGFWNCMSGRLSR